MPNESTHAHFEFSSAQLLSLRGHERYLKEPILAHKHDVVVRLRIKLGRRVDRLDGVPTRVEPSTNISSAPPTKDTRPHSQPLVRVHAQRHPTDLFRLELLPIITPITITRATD